MSETLIRKDGRPIGETSAGLPAQNELPLELPSAEKPFYIKITPRTELYTKVTVISELLGLTKTATARHMMRNGWIGFRRFLEREGL